MSILAWLSVVLLPTVVIPTTLTFTLSSKSKEIVDGLDKLGIVNRKEKKERTNLAPVVNMPSGTRGGSGSPPAPPAKPAAAKPPSTSPAPTTPKEPAPTTPKEPAPTTPKEPSDDSDQDGASQSNDGDGQAGGDSQGEAGEPGQETEGPKITTEQILRDAVERIQLKGPSLALGKGDIVSAFEVKNAIDRLALIIADLQKQASGAVAPTGAG